MAAEAERIEIAATGEYSAALAATSKPLRIEVQEYGVDVRVSIEPGAVGTDGQHAEAGESLIHGHDGFVLRRGRHLAILPGSTGARILRIKGDRPGSNFGSVTVKITPVDLGDSQQAAAFALDLLELELAARVEAETGDEQSLARARQLVEARARNPADPAFLRSLSLTDDLFTSLGQREQALLFMQAHLDLLIEQASDHVAIVNNMAMHAWRMGRHEQSQALIERASKAASSIDAPVLVALIHSNHCLIQFGHVAIEQTIDCNQRALALSEATGDAQRVATGWNNLGGAFMTAGQALRATEAFERALAVRHEYGLERGAGTLLSNYGLQLQALGRFTAAHLAFERSRQAFEELGDKQGMLLPLEHSGRLALVLGEHDRALQQLSEVVEGRRGLAQPTETIYALLQLGQAQSVIAPKDPVPPALLEALSMAEDLGETFSLARILIAVATAEVRTGEPLAALQHTDQVVQLASTIKLSWLAGQARVLRAQAHLALNKPQLAAQDVAGDCAEDERESLPLDAARACLVKGEAAAALNKLDHAEIAFARGMSHIERARASLLDLEQRAVFLSTFRHLHEAQVLVRVAMLPAQPSSSQVLSVAALIDTQRARGQAEMDSAEFVRGVETEAELQQRILEQRRWKALVSKPDPEDQANLLVQIAQAEELASAKPMQALDIDALSTSFKQDLGDLPKDTMLVQTLLSANQGLAIVLTRDEAKVLKLPGESRVETILSRLRPLLRGVDDAARVDPLLAELCDLLWQPIAATAQRHRVLMVADTPLAGVPWPALRCNIADGEQDWLLRDHQFSLHSTLAQAIAYAGSADRAAAISHTLAVVDPIYGQNDPRWTGASATAAGMLGSIAKVERNGEVAGPSMPRLTASAAEASALRRLLDANEITVLSGPEANGSRVIAELQRPLRLAHFGTHHLAGHQGLSDSALLLSLRPDIESADGTRLDAATIARMRLQIDLVVLAACASQDGRVVKGEGILGTGYAFLQAGVGAVMASGWAVEDQRTAQLMTAFYDHLLGQRLSPEAALRRAQMRLLEQPYSAHPVYWAGFSIYRR